MSLSTIYGVPSVGIRRTKSETSTRRGLHTHTKKMRNFTKDQKEEISGNQRFWGKEASYQCRCASRGRDSSYLGLFPPLGVVWL